MNIKKIAELYKREEIETAPKQKILSLLHKRCLQILKESLLTVNVLKKRLLLNRVQNILSFLEHSLNITDETSLSLFYLYDYCYSLLESDDTTNITYAKEILSIIGSAFV
ncbi:MAG: flagellar protein FliS [Chitinispirillaceae bacterium]|nr:flagellar protein FliS [Chitinispirillaceae bacterium]